MLSFTNLYTVRRTEVNKTTQVYNNNTQFTIILLFLILFSQFNFIFLRSFFFLWK